MKLRRKAKKFFNAKVIGALFLVSILLFSVLGFIMGSVGSGNSANSNTFTYNEYDFKVDMANNQLILDYHGSDLPFYIRPSELEFFEENETIDIFDKLLFTKELIVSFDPNLQTPEFIPMINQRMLNYYAFVGKTAQFGLTEDSLLYDDFVVATCNDATAEVPVLIFKDGFENEVLVSEDGNCITVVSQDSGHRIRFYEKVSYNVLGVMTRQ